jgi:hypothetical protein
MMTPAAPPVLLLEPNFRTFAGHYARYARVIGAEARRKGMTICVASSKEITNEARRSLEQSDVQVMPVFPRVPRTLGKNRAVDWHATQIMLAAALHAYHVTGSKHVAWLSGLPAHIEPMALFAEQVSVSFPFQLISFAKEWRPGIKAAPVPVRYFLRRAAAAGVHLYAQTRPVANAAQEECDVPFAAFPPILELKAPRPPRPLDKPRVGLMNIALSYKEWDTALTALEANSESLATLVHTGITGAERSADIRTRCEKIGAVFHSGALLPDAFNEAWLSLDAVLLPYAQDVYARRGSGMFFESLADAIIPIVPAGTSMAALAEDKGVGIIYDPSDPGALDAAIKRLVSQYARLSASSRAVAPAWREQNSPSKVFSLLERDWSGSPRLIRSVAR